jgi:PAS domain S-box-containing protein
VATDQAVLGRPVSTEHPRFRAILEDTFDIIVILDPDGRIRYESPSIVRVLGYEPSERQNQGAFDLVHPDDVPKLSALFRDVVSGRIRHSQSETRVHHKNGGWRTLEATFSNLIDDPNVQGIVVVARDVTEHRAAEEARAQALENEHVARTAAEYTLDKLFSLQSVADLLSGALSPERVAAIVVDHGVRAVGAISGSVGVLDPSAQDVELIGYRGRTRRVQEWLRFPLSSPVPIADAIRTSEPVWIETLAEWKSRYPDVAGLRPRGYRATAALPVVVNGRIAGGLGLTFARDHPFGEPERLFMHLLARQCGQALERARLYQEVAEREHRLAELVRRLLASQEEERRRLAYELHDGIAQVATATHQHLQVLASRFPPEQQEQREELNRGLELAQRTVREARDLIRGLRPTVLDDFGLARAVLVETEALETDGWPVTLDERLGGARLPAQAETALYRVLQEALSNVRKHAGMARVHVSLQRRGQTVRLVVRDWGRGFSVSADGRSADVRNGHIGLEGMRERVTLLGGQFSIRSQPRYGTTIEARLPVS